MTNFNVRKRYRKLLVTFHDGELFLNHLNTYPEFQKDPIKLFLLRTGLLNHIWQNWSLFWRSYWLSEILGGIDIHGKRICPYNSTLTETQAVHFLLNGDAGNTPHHFEKSWGDKKYIEKVALNILNVTGGIATPTVPMTLRANTVLSALSLLGTSVEHLQKVRNVSVHFDHINDAQLAPLLVNYVLPTYKFPTDILHSRTVANGKKAIVSWNEELATLLSLV